MQKLNLNTNFIGKEIIYYHKIDSTQMEIWRRVENNQIKNGTIVIADIQTQGKRNTRKSMAYRRRQQYCFFSFPKS